MSIFQERFMQLSVGMGNTVIYVNDKEGVVLPSNLQKGLSSATSVDNIDCNIASCNSLSINWHISSESESQLRILSWTLSIDTKLKYLPK